MCRKGSTEYHVVRKDGVVVGWVCRECLNSFAAYQASKSVHKGDGPGWNCCPNCGKTIVRLVEKDETAIQNEARTS